MSNSQREVAILESVRKQLAADGYDVVIQPNSLLVPPFLSGFNPDALAFRKDKNLIVEVANRNPASLRRLEKIQERIAGEADWELRLIWTSPLDNPRVLQSPVEVIRRTLVQTGTLWEEGRYQPAFLLGWSALEAIGRALEPAQMKRPQTPARLIERLARSGALSPLAADQMRELISKRNRLAHGDLRTDVRRKDIEIMLKILWELLEKIGGNDDVQAHVA